MASRWAFLALLALPGALGQPGGEDKEPCAYEPNRIKDLLQASCAGKGLSEVPPGLREGTGILLLGSNRLARVSTASFRALPNLTELDLSRNGLGELEAAFPLPVLQELDLSHNALEALPALQGLPSLVRLALGHNALAGLPEEGGFRALGRLVDLELQGNRLQSLPEGAFAGLAALKDLDLSDNRLAGLPPELLAELGALETLRLERNRLRSLPEGFFPEEHLFAYVYLVGNPWLCDCALEYLREWITENTFSVYTRVQGHGKEITENAPKNVTCQDPPQELGRPVMEFHRDCGLESERGLQGDEEEERPEPRRGPTPTTPNPLPTSALSTLPPFPATTGPFFPQPEPSPPTPPSPTSLPTSKSTPLAHPSTTATPSPSPTTRGGLATTLPTAAATSPLGLPPASTTATADPGETATPPQEATSTRQATPAPTIPTPTPGILLLPATPQVGSSARPPATPPPLPPGPPASCHCPLLPGTALGLASPQAPPASWDAWLAARCCPLRLALYGACLALLSLSTLALLGWWVGACMGARHPRARQHTQGPQRVGYQLLQMEAPEGGGPGPLPRPRLYRACQRLEVGPLRYVSWLLVSLPGPSGQWPWEREGSWGPGKDPLVVGWGRRERGGERATAAAATL